MIKFLLYVALIGVFGCTSQVTNPIEDYKEARKIFWQSLYSKKGNTLYCQEPFRTSNKRGINIEHVFPMSWATNGLNCGTRKQCRARSPEFNQIEADLHNLYPSRVDVNKERSSFRFGEVRGERRIFGKSCDFEVDQKARSAEPTPSVRGEVARAMFYMADRYKARGLVLFEKQAKLMHEWHLADPPSQHEKERNNIIESLQGNRNRFIDEPQVLTDLYLNGYFRN